MSTRSYTVKELTTLPEMLSFYPLLRQSHTHVSAEDYTRLLPEMIAQGYKQVGIFDGETCVALSGFWIHTKVYCGRYIEMDNVVVDAAHRSSGIGKLLADWIIQKGKAANCTTALLDVYVYNTGAHRFYLREGYATFGYHMHRAIPTDPEQEPTLFQLFAMSHPTLPGQAATPDTST